MTVIIVHSVPAAFLSMLCFYFFLSHLILQLLFSDEETEFREVKILTKDTYLVSGRIINCRALNIKSHILCLSHLLPSCCSPV